MTDLPTDLVLEDFQTLPQLLSARVEASGSEMAYRFWTGSAWRPVTWLEFHRRILETATGLVRLGLKPADTVAIIGETRPEWGLTDLAVLVAGGTTVGLHPMSAPAQLVPVIRRIGCRMVAIQDTDQLEKLRLVADQLDSVEKIILWKGADRVDAEREISLFQLNRLAREGGHQSRDELAALQAGIDGQQVANLFVTPGTTATPKIVPLTHANLLAALRSVSRLGIFRPRDHTVSYLPMADAGEKILGFYNRIATGLVTSFSRGPAFLLEELAEVRPTVFGATPAFFEMAHDVLSGRIERGGPAARALFAYALKVGRQAMPFVASGRPLPPLLKTRHLLIDALLFKKLRENLGGRLRCTYVGGAPLRREVLETFFAMGIPLYELYGLTETAAVATTNRPGTCHPGSVGKAVPGVDLSLSERGEILIRGENVFAEYLDDPQATADAIDAKGWLHTGDLGRIDGEGYLWITERRLNLITLTDGKTIAPRNIEQLIQRHRAVASAFVVGDRRPHLTALISLDPAVLGELVDKLKLSGAELERCCREEALVRHIQKAVAQANEELSPAEQVRDFRILPRGLSLDLGEVTPNRKTRRSVVLDNFSSLIDEMYP